MKKSIQFSFIKAKGPSLLANTLMKSKWSVLMVVLLSVTTYSCKHNLELSQQFKAKAEKTIQLARSVDADKYAPNEFKSAVSSFDRGNLSLAKKNVTEANNNFAAAIASASNAYNIALPLFVKKLIDETDRQIEVAKTVLKETASLEKPIALNAEARSRWNQGNFIVAREKTLEARESIQLTRQLPSQVNNNTLPGASVNEIQDAPIVTILGEERALQEGERVYTVKLNFDDRDCLWKIAKREMGDPLYWESLYRRNENIVNDPNLIFPNQKLIIPVE